MHSVLSGSPSRPAQRQSPGREEKTVPDFAVAAMVIIVFVSCALGLRVAGGRTTRVVRVSRRPHRPNRAMMDL
ncbi:hypothetical protein C5E45_12365 [Nocardia nova]|uniref:Uncharacterized protein n=1 Tax=Nocardia nova TaxID=37330 RepID=A0A2S6ARW7_9NOCA|nr:hypothetical protein C5E45_12365 [Nocardia nova]